jgi:hypothetical protein
MNFEGHSVKKYSICSPIGRIIIEYMKKKKRKRLHTGEIEKEKTFV